MIQGRVIQVSSWVINGEPAGLAFREGKAGTDFYDSSPFAPHVVKGAHAPGQFEMTNAQSTFRKAFYGADCIELTKTQKINSGCVVKDDLTRFKKPTAEFTSNGQKYKPADATPYKTWPSYQTITIPPNRVSTNGKTALEMRKMKE